MGSRHPGLGSVPGSTAACSGSLSADSATAAWSAASLGTASPDACWRLLQRPATEHRTAEVVEEVEEAPLVVQPSLAEA